MVTLIKNKAGKPIVQFIITHAFVTPKEVQEKFGIMLNFGAKWVVNSDELPIPLEMQVSNLQVRLGENNQPFLGSKYEQVEREGGAAMRIYNCSLFPRANQDDDEDTYNKKMAAQATFMEEVMRECIELVNHKRHERAVREEVGAAIDFKKIGNPLLEQLNQLAPAAKETKKRMEDGDIPI